MASRMESPESTTTPVDVRPPRGRITQVAVCCADVPRLVRRYVQGFGFRDAGGRVMYGERVASIQGLGADTTFLLWWLVGKQDHVQLEIFCHSDPAPQPLMPDWSPNDHGWVRMGISTSTFDAALEASRRFGVRFAPVQTIDGVRRTWFRDPDVGVIVDVADSGPLSRSIDGLAAPAIEYVTLSVADLSTAEEFYLGCLGLERVDVDVTPASFEAAWGLPGAEKRSFVARGTHEILVEFVEYITPRGRPRPSNARVCDQGIMNIGLGFDDRTSIEAAVNAVENAGVSLNTPLRPHPLAATYIEDPQGYSVEMLRIPFGFEGPYGLEPLPEFPPKIETTT